MPSPKGTRINIKAAIHKSSDDEDSLNLNITSEKIKTEGETKEEFSELDTMKNVKTFKDFDEGENESTYHATGAQHSNYSHAYP